MRFQKLPISNIENNASQLDLAAKAKSLAICSTPEARQYLDYEQSSALCALPLGFVGSGVSRTLQFAVANKSDTSLNTQLKFAADFSKINCIEVDSATLRKAIEIAYRADDVWLEKGLDALAAIHPPPIKFHTADLDIEDSKNPVPQALKTLIEYAIAKDASDIHLIPTRDGLSVKLRVHGELLSHQQAICTLDIARRLLSRIKILSSLRIDERALPQDGSFTLNLKSGARQLRVSTLPTIHGEKCVMRITTDTSLRSLKTIGFSSETLAAIESALKIGSGLILLSGSTGSGKSTTLYAITQSLLSKNLSISSVEDPVEAIIEGISQTSLAPEKGLDYPNALRSILRQDPDVILVGEIRDTESARLVISAALTGHLVLSTVHGSNINESVTRLTQMGIDQITLSQVLRLMINQTLLKKLCTKCKVLDLLASQRLGFRVFKAVGCAHCDYSGFDGRLLLAERMYFDSDENLTVFMQTRDNQLMELNGYEGPITYLENYVKSGLIVPDQF